MTDAIDAAAIAASIAAAPDLTSLIDACEAANGLDRILDAQIAFALFAKPRGAREYVDIECSQLIARVLSNKTPEAMRKKCRGQEFIEWQVGEGRWIHFNAARAPKLTLSLDAVIDLHGRLFPGAPLWVNMWSEADRFYTTLRLPDFSAHGDAPWPARALLAAVLRAKIKLI